MVCMPLAAVPTIWKPYGIGGGGSMFSPSINPDNDNEFYIGCDMSELFHSTDFGNTYSTVPFYQIQGGHNSTVRFTSNAQIRYCISYVDDIIVPVKSTDGGSTWKVLSGNPDASDETYSIYADYNHPDRVIISTYGAVFFSSNGGTTFTSIHSAQNSGNGVIVGGAFFTGDTIIVGTSDGLVVSTDAGVHFAVQAVSGITSGQAIFSFAGAKQGNTIRFFCLTGNAADMYVGIAGTDYWGFVKGVYSLDWGTGSWTPRISGITIDTDYPMFIAMASNNINVAYCGGSNSSGNPLVLKTTNGGTNWQHVFNTTNNQNIITGWSGTGGDRDWGYGECLFGIAVAPTNVNKVIISDMGFVHTTSDGGISWKQAYVSTADQHAAGAVTPPKHSYHSIGLENTSCWQVFWADSAHMFAPYTDIRGMRSTDAGMSWSFDYTGYSANTMYRIVKNGSGTMYAATSRVHDMYQSTRLANTELDASDADGNVIYSSDKGATWQVLHAFGHPVFWLALDPNNPNTMYASVTHSTLGRVYVTHNLQNGTSSTWEALPVPPRTEGHPACIVVLNDGSVVCTYSGHRNPGFTSSSGTFLYNPTTNAWSDRSDAGMHYWTKDIVVDPFDASQNTWYVGVFSGWGGAPNGLGGLYKTTNRGQAWIRINDLDRVTSCTINPNDHNDAYLTTETSGLWHSSNFANATPSFARVDSYPFRQPERVFFNPYKPSEVWVTSFGNGMRMGETGAATVSPDHKNNQIHNAFKMNVYNGVVTIDCGKNMKDMQAITVLTLYGKIIKQINSEKNTDRFVFSVGKLPKGVYIVKVGNLSAGNFAIVK